MQDSRKHRKYDRQFKEAVRLVKEGGRQIIDAARSLGIHENHTRTVAGHTGVQGLPET